MTFKEIIVNILSILLGILLISIAIGYIGWLYGLLIKINPPQTFINIVLISLAFIIPSLILLGGGFCFFIKTLIDPWES